MKTYAIISYRYAHNWQNTTCTMQLLVTTWMKTNLQLFLYGRLPPNTKIYFHLICDLRVTTLLNIIYGLCIVAIRHSSKDIPKLVDS